MRTEVLPWLEYRWNFDFPAGMFPAILERLRGTPDRLARLLEGRPRDEVTRRPGEKWSSQQHAGHLWSVETLWRVRLGDYLRGSGVLTAADMENRATEHADYNAFALADLLAGFRSAREELVTTLATLDAGDVVRVAHHPRLDRPLRLVDTCFFAAEHDDHHLAAMRALLA